MKHITTTLLSVIISITTMHAQIAEIEGFVRISSLTPQLELYDSGVEDRLEGTLREFGNNIWLEALVGELVLDALLDVNLFAGDDIFMTASDDMTMNVGNDVFIKSNDIVFGNTTTKRTDFTFHHGLGGGFTDGLTIENDGNFQSNNNNRWTFYAVNSVERLDLYNNASSVGSFASDGMYTSSDKKLKKNIKPLDEVLPGILALNPSKYDYIHSPKQSKKSIGFIAQEVNKYFPDLVMDDPMDDGEVVMMLNYAGFGVLAIKAIQEQQEQIAEQEELIVAQSNAIEALQEQVNNLIARVSTVEESGR